MAAAAMALAVAAVVVPAGSASARHRECAPATDSPTTKENGPYSTTVHWTCGEVLDWWDEVPSVGVADPDPGSGSGTKWGPGGGGPGSLNSCLEIEDEISTLQAALAKLVIQRDAIQGNIVRYEADVVTTRAELTSATQRQGAAAASLQATITSVIAKGGSVIVEFDSRGKPIPPDPDIRAAETRLGIANAGLQTARGNASYAETRLRSARESLAVVESNGTATELQLYAALDREKAEKCTPP